jgi:tetratricopeptide (TPR) repeat protein
MVGGGALLVVLVIAAYLPAARCGYIWDDDAYILNNDTLRTLDGLKRIWLKLTAAPQEYPQYYPLVYTTFWLEYRAWGTDPLGYHATNVVLHALATVLLWRVLVFLRVPVAWWAAALFGMHPVHVESVAWITERKNVLSGVFYLAAALTYLRFALPGSDAAAPRGLLFYVLALVLFLCALLSKTVTCTLPAVLVLVLWWQRGQVRARDLLLLAPFFVLGLAFGLLTSWMERQYVGAAGRTWSLDVLQRCLLASRIPWFYLGKLLWPHPLIFVYPRWSIEPRTWQAYAYPLATLALIDGLLLARRRIGRGPLVAVLCFGGTLFPALGFFDVYPMRYSFVADHFQYLASAAILALLAASGWHLARRLAAKRMPVAGVAASLILATLVTLTWRQLPVYDNLETLWRDTLRKNPVAWMAHNNLGHLLQKRGALDEAATHFMQAMALAPDQFEPYANLGDLFVLRGQPDQALRQYRRAVELDPRQPLLHYNLATLLADRGQLDEAASHYRQALALSPEAPPVHLNLGWVLMKQAKLDEAAEHFRAAIQLRPRYAEAHLQLGLLRVRAGQIDAAIACYRQALEANAGYAPAHYQLGVALARQGQTAKALAEYREAVRLDPNDVDARRALEAAGAAAPNETVH